jgi:hypothetical protein
MGMMLTALKQIQPEWIEKTIQALSDNGYSFQQRNAQILAWDDMARSEFNNTQYSDGWSLGSLWLGPGSSAVGVTPRRLYFEHSGVLDFRKEHEILGDKLRQKIDIALVVARTLQLCEVLCKCSSSCLDDLVELSEPATSLTKDVEIVSGKMKYQSEASLNSIYSHCGFDKVPEKMAVVVASEIGVGDSRTNEFIESLKAATNSFKMQSSVAKVKLESLLLRLREIRSGRQLEGPAFMVLFLLNDEQQPLSEKVLEAVSILDGLGLQWRRAYSNDEFRWSVRDQMGSILSAAGGRTHRIEVLSLPLPWSVGIDISHPVESVYSKVCVTVVDQYGQLARAWTMLQPRNEEIKQPILRQLLCEVSKFLKEAEVKKDVLIIRDGRLFENENSRFYRESFPSSVTLVEIRKRRNPLLFNPDTRITFQTPRYGQMSSSSVGHNVGFMMPLPINSQSGLPTTLKIHWRDDWDGMRLGSEYLPKVLYALTKAPGLGMRPHTLPAPIYWADGIAAASDKNLKFRGQRVINL